MALFREHRETLVDSMETIMPIEDRRSLLVYLSMLLGHKIKAEDMQITLYILGENIKCWENTYLVTVDNEGVIGYTNEYLEQVGGL